MACTGPASAGPASAGRPPPASCCACRLVCVPLQLRNSIEDGPVVPVRFSAMPQPPSLPVQRTSSECLVPLVAARSLRGPAAPQPSLAPARRLGSALDFKRPRFGAGRAAAPAGCIAAAARSQSAKIALTKFSAPARSPLATAWSASAARAPVPPRQEVSELGSPLGSPPRTPAILDVDIPVSSSNS